MRSKSAGLLILILAVFGSLLFFYWLNSQKTLQFFDGSNQQIRYVGRFDKTEPTSPKVWAPGAYIEFNFEGTFCEIELEDELRFLVHHNYIEIVIDGGVPKRMQLSSKFNTVKIGRNLSKGKHHVVICKNTESAIGYLKFNGVRCASLLPLKKSKKKYFEFIGDSITCANGSDNSQIPFNKGKWYDYHNAYMSYAALLARKYNVDYLLSAVSGIGLKKSCCGIDYSMPDVYDRISFDKNNKKWDFTKQPIPTIVFITLGQNDGFNTNYLFEKAYVGFIQKLRLNYKNSTIICCVSPMSSKKLKRQLTNCIDHVVLKVLASGDKKIMRFAYNNTYNEGYDKHPTLAQHQLMMKELYNFVAKNALLVAKN